jgi:hypothetical protein
MEEQMWKVKFQFVEQFNLPLWGRGTALAVDEVIRFRRNALKKVYCSATSSVKNQRFLTPSPKGKVILSQ